MSEIKVTAHFSDGIKATGSLGKVVEVPVSIEPYTGDYNISVTDSDVIIPIKDKMASDNITIHQGRAEVPTYQGQSTFTVTDADITVQSKGFKFDENLTIKQGRAEVPNYTGLYSVKVNNTQTLPTSGKKMTQDLMLSTDGIIPTGTLNITTNGAHNVTNYANASVNVPSVAPALGTKTITENGTYSASDDALDGYSSVTVDVDSGGGGYSLEDIALGAEPSGEIEISDSVSTLRDGVFQKTNITSVTWNATIMRGLYPFQNSELQSFSAPYATEARGKILCNCQKLTDVSLPQLQDIVSDQFIENTKITQLVLPSMTGAIYARAFRYNRLLKIADLGETTQLQANAFLECNVLDTVILRKSDAICTLQNVNTFNGTPFASGKAGGEIYVPSALIDTYKAAANWSTLDGYGTVTWKAIEGSIYEHAYADGTPIA